MPLFIRTFLPIAFLAIPLGYCNAQTKLETEPRVAQNDSPPTYGILAGRFDPTRTFRVATTEPNLELSDRSWADVSGKRTVVATLRGRTDGKLVFERADGNRFVTSPESLSLKDRVYAIYQTEPRVNRSAQVLLGKIISARDGDTIQLLTMDGRKVAVRLDGIDAPESKQDYGLTTTKWLQRFVGRDVRIEYFQEDRDRRVLGQIYFTDRWVNYEMVLAGMAWHYDKYNVDDRLAGAHAYAKKLKRGIWQQAEQVAPWDYRNGVRKKTTNR